MLGFTLRTLLAIAIGLLVLIAVSFAFTAELFADAGRRQKPTPRTRNRMEWARS
jgi:hypothetical protein